MSSYENKLSRRAFGGAVGVTAAAAAVGLGAGPAAAAETMRRAARGGRGARLPGGSRPTLAPPEHPVRPGRRPRLGGPVLIRLPAHRDPEPGPAGPPGRPVHRRLLGVRDLLADPVQPLHRPLPGPHRGRAGRADRRQVGRSGPDPPDAGLAAEGGRLLHRADRQVARGLPARPQPDEVRLGRVLRQLRRGPGVLLQAGPGRRVRPLRGRRRVQGPALLHADHHRAGIGVRLPRPPRQAVAAEPELHHPALALDRRRGHGAGRRDRPPDQGGRRARPVAPGQPARSRSTSRWSRTSTGRSARC